MNRCGSSKSANKTKDRAVNGTQLDELLWHWTDEKIIQEVDKVSSPLSDAISKDLKKRGMKFVGTVIIYAYLQAVGVINSHESGCFLNPLQQ